MSQAPRFLVGLTRDLLTPQGVPSFGSGPLALLADDPHIDWEFLPENTDEITPQIAARYDALYVNSPRVTAASVAGADRRVKLVARHGVGYDSVDVAALAAQGVIATNTPVAVRRPVAVAALTFIFALAGRLMEKDRMTRAGRWNERTGAMGLGLTTRTLGVIGAGGIGQELLALARPFGWKMLAADPYVNPASVAALGAECVPLERLLQTSDFVVATVLLNEHTHHLMNAARFASDEAQCLLHQPVARADCRRDGAHRCAHARCDCRCRAGRVRAGARGRRQRAAEDGQRAGDAARAVLDR